MACRTQRHNSTFCFAPYNRYSLNTANTPPSSPCTTEVRFDPRHTTGCCWVTEAGHWSGPTCCLAYEKPAAAGAEAAVVADGVAAAAPAAAAAAVWLW